MRLDIPAGRAVLAALLAWMAWIHLHLWQDGYRHLHVVGPLFLTGSVAAVIVAAAVLVAPSRRLPVPALAGVALAAGTLLGLAVSVNHGLFGFRDSLEAPFARLSIVVEALVVAVGLALTLRIVRPYGSRRATGGRESGRSREGRWPA